MVFPAAGATTINPNQPVIESLQPDILYINFDGEDENFVISQAEEELTATIERGKVDEPPGRIAGPGEAFGGAMEFNYGSHPPFQGMNDHISGNHLLIPDEPALRLAGQSFTLGAWIQLPESAELPPRVYKKIVGKGGHAGSHPGWSMQISTFEETWSLTLLLVDSAGEQTRIDARLPGHGLEPGAWHHVAASYDAESNRVVLWFDGFDIVSSDAMGEVGESDLPLVIGENGMSTFSNTPLGIDDLFITSGVHEFSPVEDR